MRNYQVANIEMFYNEDNNDNDRKKESEKKPKDDINISTADLYSYTITIIYIYWQKQDTIECLKSLVLFYAYHFLHITNDV